MFLHTMIPLTHLGPIPWSVGGVGMDGGGSLHMHVSIVNVFSLTCLRAIVPGGRYKSLQRVGLLAYVHIHEVFMRIGVPK